MKKSKIGKLAALLAAGALLFNGFFMSCSSDDDDGGSSSENTGGGTSESANALADSLIRIEYSDTPVIGSDGKAYIYNGETLVDTISVSDETLYCIGSPKGGIKKLNVDDQLISVEDNYVVIVPHNDENGYSVLAPNTTYTVKFDDGLVKGTRASDKDFSFTTRSSQSISNNIINVGSSDSDNFYTIQGAFNYLRKTGASGDWTINVAAGKYHENLFYYGSANVKLVGSDSAYGADTYVYWRNSQVLNGAQRARQSFIWQGGNLTVENMTFENTTNRKVEGNTNVQAETLVFDVAKNLVGYNSSFISYQDTLLIGNNGGRAWFYKCYVSGDVDFIWGTADVCMLEDCKIVCRADGIKNDAKIFASRTVATNDTVAKGFVLTDSEIEVEEGCSAAYGRSSGADTQAAVFNNKFTKGSPNASLWGSASDTVIYEANGEMAVGYKDYNNTLANGSVIDTSKRTAKTADMSERLYNREYNGRWVIFNRVYNRKTGSYEFASNIYDISSVAESYSAPADTSVNNIYVEPVFSDKIVGGKNVQLSVSSKASGLTYTYVSSDETLATVGSDGNVSTVALADGTVEITVTASNGKTDVASVKVIPDYVAVESISIDSDESVDMYALNTVTATLSPSDATEPNIVWTATGNIKIVDPDNKILVDTLTTVGNSVQIEGIESGNGTITAKSESNSSAVASADITVSDVRKYNAVEAVAVNSKTAFGILNFQSGKVGIWHDVYVHAIYDSKNGKIAASGERIQSRYGTLYIPVTESCIIDMACQAFSDSVPYASDFIDAESAAPETYEGDEEIYKYHYKWEYDAENDTGKKVSGSTVKALFDSATKDSNRTREGAEPDENATYFAINIPGNDRYISSITITKDSSIHHEPVAATLTIEKFAESSKTLDLNGDTSCSQTTTGSASDGSEVTVVYSSSKPAVATVDSSTGAVTVVSIGQTTISATVSKEGCEDAVVSYNVLVKDTAEPTAGYTIDFNSGNIFTAYGNTLDFGKLKINPGNKNAYGLNNGHGATFKEGNSVELKVPANATVKVAGCQYNNDTSITATVSSGSVTPDSAVSMKGSEKGGTSSCSNTTDFSVTEACTITLAFTGSTTYVATVEVAVE